MTETVLGFDVGRDKIGVAVGNTLTGLGQALTVLPALPEERLWAEIGALLKTWRPARVVVGLPLTLDGQTQAATDRAERFRTELERRYALPTLAVDERYSTREARRRFALLRRQGLARKQQGAALDALAAAVIVEDHLATARR